MAVSEGQREQHPGIPSKRINNHENDFIERWRELRNISAWRPCSQTRKKSFMGEEARSKDEDRVNGQDIGEKA
jgi:hypothetical protein